jgi:hypothetical protein
MLNEIVAVTSAPIFVRGIVVGELVSLRQKVVMFTTRRDLAAFDGRAFDSPESAAIAVAAVFVGT